MKTKQKFTVVHPMYRMTPTERDHWRHMQKYCKATGKHNYRDDSTFGPDSATDCQTCRCCGYSWSHTWF